MQDRFGNSITCTSADAAALYTSALDLMLTAWPGAEPLLEQALKEDPAFALAHIARARVLQMQGRMDEAHMAIAAAMAQHTHLDDRERSHTHTLSLAINGDGAGALAAIKNHIHDWPRDGLILSLITGVYGLLGFSGIADHHQQQRDMLDAIASHWGDDWWFIAYRGWAHVEAGDAAFGAPMLETSLTQRKSNGNAAHGKAHACYELGDVSGGSRFLDEWLPGYEANAPLLPHLSWHLALFALRLGDTAKAERLYDGHIDPALGRQPPFFTIVDAGAFNWRCLLRGVQRPADALQKVSSFASDNFSQGGIGFANVHVAYAHAANSDHDALKRHLAMTAKNAERALHPSANTVHAVCQGIHSFAEEDYTTAVTHLESALPELPRIGGSHAQRDGVWETLVAACMRCGNYDRAEKLLETRLGLNAIFQE